MSSYSNNLVEFVKTFNINTNGFAFTFESHEKHYVDR